MQWKRLFQHHCPQFHALFPVRLQTHTFLGWQVSIRSVASVKPNHIFNRILGFIIVFGHVKRISKTLPSPFSLKLKTQCSQQKLQWTKQWYKHPSCRIQHILKLNEEGNMCYDQSNFDVSWRCLIVFDDFDWGGLFSESFFSIWPDKNEIIKFVSFN